MPIEYAVCDVIYFVAATLVGAVGYWAKGHAGLVAVTMVFTGMWSLSELVHVFRLLRGHVPVYHVSSIPQGPDFPAPWHIVCLVLEVLALVSQLILGLTLLSGIIIVFLFGGVYVIVHLKFYSGSVPENAATMLPILAVNLLAYSMVLTTYPGGAGNMGLNSRTSELLWLLLMSPAGALAGNAFISFLGVNPKEPDASIIPIFSGNHEKT
mmetsp:Transcript_73851/g.131038  ORF Transcript_73851/g.131038 Transcript_73851/m.131038 type:complete len:210 (-) Transcript_73851:175-804(-)